MAELPAFLWTPNTP